jgi:hypothetical protein
MAVAMAFALGTFAQGINAQDRNGSASQSSRSENVVVTGCLVSGASESAGMSGATGTSGSTSANARGDFMLTNAIVSSGGSGGAMTGDTAGHEGAMTGGHETTNPSSTAANPSAQDQAGKSAADSGKSFKLVGQQADLSKNVNSRVEVRGTIEGNKNSGGTDQRSTAGTSGSTAGNAGGSATGSSSTSGSMSSGSLSNAGAGMQETLRVSSVRKIGGSCSR